MKSRLASVRIASGLDRVDCAVRLLEDEWRRHGEVRLENFWTQQQCTEEPDPADSLGTLAALVKADLRRRFELGETPAVAGYLERFPELRTADSRVLSLVYEEYCLIEERGIAPDVESFCGRYPDWKDSLASQLRYHRLISQAAGGTPPLPRFPQPGEDFEEFHLLSLLGKGGTSRVFLAENRSLGGKHVALKVTLDRGQEPNVHGPLDHPHIVPVNSVSYQREGRLCGLSMPFQLGLPLDEVIKRVKPAQRPRDAMAFWRVLADGTADICPENLRVATNQRTAPRGDGWEEYPTRGAYHQGAAWIVMMLARALDYAHGKQTYHRDVKPANVLLTITHGPQLLDFNLAESPHASDHAQKALHGGTLPYMAPEQIEAFLNPDLWGKVGARADIYSLGLVLRELLTGQMPEAPDDTMPPPRAMRDLLDRRSLIDTAVRRFNPAICHSLEAIVAKCLTLSPDDRYRDAGALARDLDRYLKLQPLIEVDNPCRRERAGNWLKRQRRPLTTTIATIGIGCILFVAALGALHNRSLSSVAGPHQNRSLPSVASLASFTQAVELFEKGEIDRASDRLLTLVKSHPQSCLAKLYLAFALGEDKKSDSDFESESENLLREAFAVPQAEIELAGWARHHSQVIQHLIGFVEDKMIRVDQFAEQYDAEDLASDIQRDNRLRKTTYDLARKVLDHVAKLNPSSQTAQRLLARTEEIFGDYASAHKRLSQLLALAASSNSLKDTELFFCRKLRGRVSFLWVEKLRSQNAQLGDDTRRLLSEALQDLNICYKTQLIQRMTHDSNRKEYRILHDKARATLTLAEVESDLKLTHEAHQHFNASRKLVDRLNKLAKSLNLKGPLILIKRLKQDSERFGPEQGFASSRSGENPPTTTAKTGTDSG